MAFSIGSEVDDIFWDHRSITSDVILSLLKLKTATLTIRFHGVSFHLAHPTTAQVKDVISVLKRKF